jgi:phosphoribosyl 1,2-cyclic phosphate phosphodiesterase
MRLEVLGSGGAVTTPKPLCKCNTCIIARNGLPKDSRFGPSVFIHGPDLLIDTPEEIYVQLNRSKVSHIAACFYSHWHPDHTSGKRIFEMNKDWINYPPKNKTTNIVLTEKIAETFSKSLGLKNHFDFLEYSGLINVIVIENNETYEIHDYRVTPVQLGQDYSFGYDIAGTGKRILIIMDELKFWIPSKEISETAYDLIYLPLGIVDVNPITNERNIDPNHPILEDEQTVLETLEYVKTLKSKQFILGHVEEPDGITYEMGEKLGEYSSRITMKNVRIAYDMLEYEI